MKKRNKALILLDVDIVVRAFVHSDTFSALKKKYDVIYCVAEDVERGRSSLNMSLADQVDEPVITVDIPRKRIGYWYFLFAAHALFTNRGSQNYEILKKYKFNLEMGKRNVLIMQFLALPGIYQVFRQLFKVFMGKSDELQKLILRIKPDIIIHPTLLTGWFINDIVPIAREQNIPTIFCMNSWDNPSSKAICTEHPDKLVVWGEQSKNESIRYLGIPSDKIEIFGAAQFQLYRKKVLETKANIRNYFNLPIGKRVLLYAGTGESINETSYLKEIDLAIENGILPKYHVLYRPHPWRGKLQKGETDFFSVAWKNISMDPTMADYYRSVIKKPTRTFFSTDYYDTHKILSIVSGVISARSTLLIEAIINGLPILVLFPKEIESDIFSSEFIHFKNLVAAPEINSCYDINRLNTHLVRMHEEISNNNTSNILKLFSNQFVDMSKPDYGNRLLELSDRLIKQYRQPMS